MTLAAIGTDRLSSICILLENSSIKVHKAATLKITSEEKSKDNETSHINERVGFVALLDLS